MTALALDAAPAALRSRAATLTVRGVVEHATVLGAVLWTLLPAAHAWGGREPHAVSVGLVISILGLVATRAWTRVPSWWLGLAALVGGSALLVLVVTPPGRYQATAGASYGLAATTVVLVAAYATTARRRTVIAAAAAIAGAVQFAWAFVPWWGGESPSTPMIGTFYWHNPYAAFLLAPALLGLTLCVTRARPWSGPGLIGAVLSTAGILFSSSRACIACVVIGWLVVSAALVWRSPARRPALWRIGVAAATTAVVARLLTSQLVFPKGGSVLAATAHRGQAQSLGGNGIYRLDVWRETLAVFTNHPLAGVGYGGLNRAQQAASPGGSHYSSMAHSGVLQALGDGGLLLAVPFTLALALVLVAAVRRWRAAPPIQLTALVALGGLTAHSLIDFDWSYPALFALTAVLAGLCVHRGEAVAGPGAGPRVRALRLGALVAVVAVCVIGAVVATSDPLAINWHPGVAR